MTKLERRKLYWDMYTVAFSMYAANGYHFVHYAASVDRRTTGFCDLLIQLKSHIIDPLMLHELNQFHPTNNPFIYWETPGDWETRMKWLLKAIQKTY